MGFFGTVAKASLPVVIMAVVKVADAAIDGSKIGKQEKQALWAGYNLLGVYGDDVVQSTDNDYDNKGVAALMKFCKDTLEEAGITVPEIPQELAVTEEEESEEEAEDPE